MTDCKFVIVGHRTPTDSTTPDPNLTALGFRSREEAQDWLADGGRLWYLDAEIVEVEKP